MRVMFDVTLKDMHTMPRGNLRPTLEEVKAVLAEDRDFLRPLVEAVLQELLEAEMTETLGAAKGERTPGRLGCQSALNGDPGSACNRDPSEGEVGGCGRGRRGAVGGAASSPARQCWEGLGSGAVLEAPALVTGLDDVAMVGQPVEQGGGHLGVAEDGGPFTEGEVGGDDHRGSLVEPADEVEQ
jgi:Transposase, Mutator family